jgi:hypothetical protein
VQRPTSVPRAPRAILGAGGGGGGGIGGRVSDVGSDSGIGDNGTTAHGRSTTGNETPAPVRVRIRNPARCCEFTGNSAMATNMRTRRVTDRGLGQRPTFSSTQWGTQADVCILALQGAML